MTAEPFLAFVECAGCHELFPARKQTGRPRKWCSEKCRKRSYGDPCVDCGGRTGYGAEAGRVSEPRCVACDRARRMAQQDARIREVSALRSEGLLNGQIAERLGTTRAAVASLVLSGRRKGVELPVTPYGPSAARNIEAQRAQA